MVNQISRQTSCLPTSLLLCLAPVQSLRFPQGGRMSFTQRLDEIRTGFERPFWVANISEIFERLPTTGPFLPSPSISRKSSTSRPSRPARFPARRMPAIHFSLPTANGLASSPTAN